MAPQDENSDDDVRGSNGKLGLQPTKRARGLKLRLAMIKRGGIKSKRRPVPSLATKPWKNTDVAD